MFWRKLKKNLGNLIIAAEQEVNSKHRPTQDDMEIKDGESSDSTCCLKAINYCLKTIYIKRLREF